MANTYELIVKTVDQSSRSLRNIDSSLQKVGRTAKAVGVALAGIATGRIASGIVNQYREFERYRTVLTTFLGSSEKANAELARLQQLANSLPQDLKDVTQAFTILQRNGIDTSNESLKAFSNIATANAKSFSQLGEAVADALTGEFERLKEFGIKVSRENDQFVARIGDQQVAVSKSTTDLVRQLQRLGEEGGRFGGAAAANADTLDQSFSNLNGALFETAVTIGEQLRPALKDVVDDTSALLRNNEELVKQFGVGLGEAIKGTAEAIKFLAANFELIRDVALAAVFTQLAVSASNFFSQLNIRKLANGKDTMLKLGKATADTAKKLPILGFFIGKIIKLIGNLAKMTPIGRILTVGVVAATAAFAYLKDKTVELGNTTTSIGEIIKAIWWGIKEAIKMASDMLVNAWGAALEFFGNATSIVFNKVGDLFDYLGSAIGSVAGSLGETFREPFQFLMDIAKTTINTVVGVFYGAYLNIAEIWGNLPTVFFTIFDSIKNTVLDFGGRLVQQFGNIGSAVWQALQAPFTDVTFEDAMRTIGQNAFSGFGSAAREEIDRVRQVLPDFAENFRTAFDIDYVDGAVVKLQEFSRAALQTAIDIGDGLVVSLENLIIAYRESAVVAEEAVQTMNEVTTATTGSTAATDENTASTVANTAAVTENLSKYQQAIKAINDYNTNQRQTAQGMRQLEADFSAGKYSLDEFKIGMEGMGAGMDDIQNRSIAMGLSISESFKTAGDSLARGLASGIARGEGIMNSFKNFMQSILEEILYQIIQQAFIKPLISSMSAGLSTAFSAFGMGGAGAFAGGLFGGGTGIFGLLGGFLGFANGGVVPGMPTAGDSVPILATPGEVILNKRQQADVLQGAGEEPVTVNFNINAISTQTGTEFILKNKKQITGVIQQAYNTRGQSGPLG